MYTVRCSDFSSSLKHLKVFFWLPSVQADDDPTSKLGTEFHGLDDMDKRDAAVRDKKVDRPALTKYSQE